MGNHKVGHPHCVPKLTILERMYCLTQLYLMVAVCIVLLHNVQLHVSALRSGHLQVVPEILSK